MLLDKIRDLVEKITLETGVDLYDIEMKNTNKGKVLRVYITRQGGVSLADCTRVSRLMNRELDVIDLIASNYFLEVSSPGLERSLKTLRHFQNAVNENVKVTYRLDDKNVAVTGLLSEVSSDSIVVVRDKEGKDSKKKPALNEQEQSQSTVIPFKDIKKARTVYVFKGKERS